MNLQSYNEYSPLEIKFLGSPLSHGPKPLILYFSISADESLSLDPFNQPAIAVASEECRIFSMTLPGHFQGQDKYQAIDYWAEHLDELEKFINDAYQFIDHLLEKNIALQSHIGTMGLSRGGFIATHLATHPAVCATVSFAPMTDLSVLKEFEKCPQASLEKLSIKNLLEKLIHTSVRYYIGNRDTRVSTKAAFEWIEKLSEYAYQQRVRSPSAELFIIPSIGQWGHGTLPHIFEEGAQWLKKQIVK